MPFPDIKVGERYLSSENKIVKILRTEDRYSKYPFVGRFQGAVDEQHFTGKGNIKKSQYSSGTGRLVRPILTEKEVVDFFCDEPGKTKEDLFHYYKVLTREERLFIGTEMINDLLNQNRLSVVRYTTYPPSLRTTFMIFATEHGRIEIIDNQEKDFCGHQIGHIHDPMGKWDKLMEESLT